MIIGNYMMMIITAIELAATIGIPQAFAYKAGFEKRQFGTGCRRLKGGSAASAQSSSAASGGTTSASASASTSETGGFNPQCRVS